MAMIQCPNCNSTIDDTGAAFCPNCGTPLAQQPAQPVQPEQPVYQEPAQPVYQQPVQPAQPIYQPPVYQQPVYQQPVYQQPAPTGKRGNGVGTAGFVLGLIAMIFMIFAALMFYANPFAIVLSVVLLVLALILCIPALILSIVGVCKRNAKKVLAILGLVFSFITGVFFYILIGVMSAFM